jgi:hypothetical protein
MKRLLLLFFTAGTCFAGDMIMIADADFKKPDPEYLKKLEEARPKLDLSKEDDRKFVEHFEQEMYMDAMMEASGPFFRDTKLKKGDDWKKLWADRQKVALGGSRRRQCSA